MRLRLPASRRIRLILQFEGVRAIADIQVFSYWAAEPFFTGLGRNNQFWPVPEAFEIVVGAPISP
jgi:hypothetical protein